MADPAVRLMGAQWRALEAHPRLVAKLAYEGDCLVWTGAKCPKRYGSMFFRGKTMKVHRVAWELFSGPIPAGMCVCHRCDNPPCVRPDHLFLGTQSDNMRDMAAKGRQVHGITSQQTHFPEGHAPRGARASGAKLTEQEVVELLGRHANGEGSTILGRAYGVDRTTVQRILRGNTWRDAGRAALERKDGGQ